MAELRSCPPVNPNTGPCGHGVAADGPTAAQIALNGGTDMEMVSTNFRDFGAQLVASGRVPMSRINDAVRRILRVKFRAGLFDHINFNHADNRQTPIPPAYRAAARKAADESMVLLKNDNATLPFDPAKRTAVIGPLGQASGAGVSATLQEPKWTNATVLAGEVVSEVAKLKKQIQGEIVVYASRPLVRTMMEHNLVDELRLTVFPVAVGAGERLFGETSDKRPLRLIHTKTVGNGLAHLTYERAREA